jgi:hypothetical protein
MDGASSAGKGVQYPGTEADRRSEDVAPSGAAMLPVVPCCSHKENSAPKSSPPGARSSGACCDLAVGTPPSLPAAELMDGVITVWWRCSLRANRGKQGISADFRPVSLENTGDSQGFPALRVTKSCRCQGIIGRGGGQTPAPHRTAVSRTPRLQGRRTPAAGASPQLARRLQGERTMPCGRPRSIAKEALVWILSVHYSRAA